MVSDNKWGVKMKIKLAILESDVDFLKNYSIALSSRFSDKLEVYTFSNLENAMSALADSRIDVFLAGDNFEIDTSNIPEECGFAYLVDSNDIKSFKNEHTVCRFQKIDLIYRDILGIFSEKEYIVSGSNMANTNCKVLLFTGIEGGTGASSAAAACALYFAQIGENSDEENKGTKQDASLRTTFFYKIKTLTVWQWVIFVLISIASSALLCLETVWIQSNSNNWITIIKLFLTMEMLISASIIDKQIKKIPNKLVVSAYLIRVILFVPEYFLFNDTFFRVLMGSVFGFAISFFVFFLMSILTKSGIGMGDVKLVSAMGCLIGLSGTFFSVFYGMVVCMFMAIGFIAFKKRKVKDKIAFAPFIYIGYLITMLLGTF